MKPWFRLTLVCCVLVTVAGCRLGTMVRSRERTRVRRAHGFGGHKQGIRFGSRWTSAISGPRRCTDCGPYCSTRPGDPWTTEKG